jgi:hypothetical protein
MERMVYFLEDKRWLMGRRTKLLAGADQPWGAWAELLYLGEWAGQSGTKTGIADADTDV